MLSEEDRLLQQLQVHINGRTTLAVMERVQAHGYLMIKGKRTQLYFPHIMGQVEARTELPRGGYVKEAQRTI